MSIRKQGAHLFGYLKLRLEDTTWQSRVPVTSCEIRFMRERIEGDQRHGSGILYDIALNALRALEADMEMRERQ